MKDKHSCDGCGKKYNIKHLVFIRDKQLCKKCRQQTYTSRVQQSASTMGKGKVSIEDALNRVYEFRVYGSACQVCFPICLREKKFKIVLVEDDG